MKVVRPVAVLAGVLALIAACVACRIWWRGEVDRQIWTLAVREMAKSPAAQDGAKPSASHDASPAPSPRTRPRPKRPLTMRLTVTAHGPGGQIGGSVELGLTSEDPLLKQIRMSTATGVLVDGGVLVTCGGAQVSPGLYPPSGQLTQPRPDADAVLTFKVPETPLPEGCLRGLIRIQLLGKLLLDPVIGITTWNADIRGHGLWITSLSGASVLRQTPTEVVLRVKTRSTTEVMLRVADPSPTMHGQISGRDELVSAFQHTLHGNAYGLATASLSLALVAGLCILPLARASAPPRTRCRWTRAVGIGITLTGAVYAAALWLPSGGSADAQFVPLVAWAWFVLPFLLLVTADRAINDKAPGPRRLWVILPPSLASVAGAATYAISLHWTLAPLLVVALGALLASGVYVMAATGLLGTAAVRWKAVMAATVWLLYAGIVLPPGLAMSYALPFHDPWHAVTVAQALLNLWMWALTIWYGIRLLVPNLPRPVLALLPFVLLWLLGAAWPSSLIEQGPFYWSAFPQAFSVTGPAVIITLGAFWGTIVHLLRTGRIRGVWPDNLRPLTIGLAAAAAATHVVIGGLGPLDRSDRWIAYASIAAAVLSTAWLLPAARSHTAARLHAVSERQHTRFVEHLVREQTLSESRRQFLVASRAELAEGKIDPAAWDQRWRILSPGHGRPPGARHLQSLRATALGTSAGRPAWRNAVAAAAMAIVAALPISAYRAVPSLDTVRPLFLLNGWTWVLRWIAYGVIYGYAYPWLRGRTPVSKATCLFVTILPVEVLPLLYQDAEPGAFGIALLQLLGNSLAACLVLGLYWEARLVRAAGLRWGQVRNFRSLAALAVPTTTVLVAVLTAVATTAAGNLLSPAQDQYPNQPPSPPASNSATATPP